MPSFPAVPVETSFAMADILTQLSKVRIEWPKKTQNYAGMRQPASQLASQPEATNVRKDPKQNKQATCGKKRSYFQQERMHGLESSSSSSNSSSSSSITGVLELNLPETQVYIVGMFEISEMLISFNYILYRINSFSGARIVNSRCDYVYLYLYNIKLRPSARPYKDYKTSGRQAVNINYIFYSIFT